MADWARSLLLLIPMRLGVSAVNPPYREVLLEHLRDPACVGLLGGRPNRAVYIVGCNVGGDLLLGLDPHFPLEHDATEMSGGRSDTPSAELLNRTHSTDVELLPIDDVDPSLAMGFYFRSRKAFYDWADPKMRSRSSATATRIFSVESCSPVYSATRGEEAEEDADRESADSDDFVFV